MSVPRLARYSGSKPIPSLTDAVAELLRAKATSRRRETYIVSLRQYLGQFIRGRECLPISAITTEDLDRWFAERNEAPSSRAANLGRLSALFAFAIRRGWMADNPVDQIERIHIDHAPPRILTVAQCQTLLGAAPPVLLPWLTLGLFAGLRPSEAERLDWSAIRLTGPDPCVVVDAAASKVRRRRIVPLVAVACAWLALCAPQSGRVVSSHSTLRRARRDLSEATGIAWSQDVLRHTHASMRIGAGDAPDRVAADLGNSVRILLTHYRELVRREDAEGFWRLTPKQKSGGNLFG